MITEHQQRNNRAVSYTLDGDTLTVTMDGETTTYALPTDDGQWPDPPFPIQRAERVNGALDVDVIRTLNARGEPNESTPGTPTPGTLNWQPWPDPGPARRANLHQHLAQLGRRRRLALVGRSPNDPDVDSAEMMMQVEQAVLQHKRQTGRSNANDNARLGEMEALGEAMLGVWQAQQAIKAKIKDDTYTTTDDIDNAREWP